VQDTITWKKPLRFIIKKVRKFEKVEKFENRKIEIRKVNSDKNSRKRTK